MKLTVPPIVTSKDTSDFPVLSKMTFVLQIIKCKKKKKKATGEGGIIKDHLKDAK